MNIKTTKVLYVDDEYPNRLFFQLSFKGNCNVVLANSASAALEILELDQEISVVISDMSMPDMDGIEFISLAQIKFPNINYCLLTGFDQNDEIKHAIDSRLISMVFKKPFDVEEILEYIKSI